MDNSTLTSNSSQRLRPESIVFYGVAESISALFLLFCILAHLFFPKLNCRAYSLMCHTISLFVMFLTYPLRQFIKYDTIGNVVIFVLHYTSALAAFFWLNVLGYDLWKLFADLRGTNPSENPRRSHKKRILLKSAYAWGIPILMCLLNVLLGFHKDIQKKIGVIISFSNYNWFDDEMSAVPFFYVPVSILVIVNVVFFILTVINVRRASQGTEILHTGTSRKMLRLCIKLFLVMGVGWLLEIITFIPKVFAKELDESFYYIPDAINCFQGVYIFMVYVFKKKTVRMIREKLRDNRKTLSNISLVRTRTTSLPSDNSSLNQDPRTTLAAIKSTTIPDSPSKIPNPSTNFISQCRNTEDVSVQTSL